MSMPAWLGRGVMRRMRRGSLGTGMSGYVIILSIGEILISACTGDCTQCDDDLTGTGTCLGTTTDSVKGEFRELLS
jgi:hypothetical protein